MPALPQILALTFSCTPLLSLAQPSLLDPQPQHSHNVDGSLLDAALNRASAPPDRPGAVRHVATAPSAATVRKDFSRHGDLRKRQVSSNTTVVETTVTQVTLADATPSTTGTTSSPPGQSISSTVTEPSTTNPPSTSQPPTTSDGQDTTTPPRTSEPPSSTTLTTTPVVPPPATPTSETIPETTPVTIPETTPGATVNPETPLPPFTPPGSTQPDQQPQQTQQTQQTQQAQQTQQTQPGAASTSNLPLVPSDSGSRTTFYPTVPVTSTRTDADGRTTLVTYTPSNQVVSEIYYSYSTLPGGQRVTFTSYATALPEPTDGSNAGSASSPGASATIAQGAAPTALPQSPLLGWISGLVVGGVIAAL